MEKRVGKRRLSIMLLSVFLVPAILLLVGAGVSLDSNTPSR